MLFSALEFSPDLTAAWEEGICTVNLCPARDTGVPTFADTDTVCAAGVPAIQQRPVKRPRVCQNTLYKNNKTTCSSEFGFGAELVIFQSRGAHGAGHTVGFPGTFTCTIPGCKGAKVLVLSCTFSEPFKTGFYSVLFVVQCSAEAKTTTLCELLELSLQL